MAYGKTGCNHYPLKANDYIFSSLCTDLSLPDNPPLLSNCPQDWQSYFGSCFRMHSDSPLNYADAKARCEAYYPGATYLSSNNDWYEQAFTEVLFYISEVESGWFGLERNPVSVFFCISTLLCVKFFRFGVKSNIIISAKVCDHKSR